MAVFLVLSDRANPQLGAKIKEAYPENFYEIANDNQWAVATGDVTTNDVKNKLGLQEGPYGRVVVFKTSGSAGWHKKSLWEWLALKEERD